MQLKNYAQCRRLRGILGIVFFLAAECIYGQEISDSSREESRQLNSENGNYTVRVGVEEVRLDAVVLDGNWKPITDLAADDFEIYQDKAPQKVLSSIYITNHTSQVPAPRPLDPKRSRMSPSISPVLKRENVNRVVMFIVDDLSMSCFDPRGFIYRHFAQMALQRFVERQMQPGDMVAILRTGYGNSAVNVFASDKRELQSKIEKVGCGGSGNAPGDSYGIYEGQLSILRYGIRALRDMPGRKAMLLITAQPTIRKDLYQSVDEMFAGKDIDYNYMYGNAYNRMADEALRARVVVHVMDIRGLEVPAMDALHPGSPETMEPDQLSRQAFIDLDRQKTEALNPIPRKTGGTYTQNSNFFLNGIGEQVNNMLRGYYLLSYAPPSGTFEKNKAGNYHAIKVRVKRHGATVYTRDGFYGLTEERTAPRYRDPMQEAIFSPFLKQGLRINLASGFIDDVSAGYLLRSWLQVDAQDVTITEKPGEGYFAKLETRCLTTDTDGRVQDARMFRYDFRIRKENLAWVRDHGIRFSLLLPVKKPGAYYVRAAVRDSESGKIGSAYQFIQIPDLHKNRLAVSNIFVVDQEEDAEWIKAGKMKGIAQTAFEPVLRRDERRSPAARQYATGEDLQYMVVLYNAKWKKELAPNLEVQSILHKDGAEVYKSEFKHIELGGGTSYDRIPIAQKLTLGSTLSKGDYVLELLIRDKNRKEKDGLASQALDFQITKN